MPTGPKGQKRPADVIGNAVHVMRVLTGEAAQCRIRGFDHSANGRRRDDQSIRRHHRLMHFRHTNRLVVRRFIFRIVPNNLYVMPFAGFCEAA
jgi:hypothetical protein